MTELAKYKQKYKNLLSKLPERAKRLVAAADAQSRGYGGIKFIHRASGMSAVTIRKGIIELETDISLPENRQRQPGGGRKDITITDKFVNKDLTSLVSGSTRGDPESSLQWTNKSTRILTAELQTKKHIISHTKVSQLLKTQGYTMQANQKTREGLSHPDRNAQLHLFVCPIVSMPSVY